MMSESGGGSKMSV